jgi:hypothetical protein
MCAHLTMKTNASTTPIRNVRLIRALIADAPANFAAMAEEAGLPFVEEAATWGTRFVIDFTDLPRAKASHPLVQQLTAIRDEDRNYELGQIWLETK